MTRRVIDLSGVAEEATSHRAATKPKPKQSGKGVAPALGAGVVRISLHLQPATIRKIKSRAAEAGLTPSQVVAALVEEGRKQ